MWKRRQQGTKFIGGCIVLAVVTVVAGALGYFGFISVTGNSDPATNQRPESGQTYL